MEPINNQDDKASTKERILIAAIALFAEKGFGVVTMREIAKGAGITQGAIYNHFESKDRLLECLYEFFLENHKKVTPDTEMLLEMAETAPVGEIFEKIDMRFPSEIREMMHTIISIAVREFSSGFCNEELIRYVIFDHIHRFYTPLLNRLIELERIEPINVTDFVNLITSFSFGAALTKNTSLRISEDEWRDSLALAFSLIRPTGK